MKSKHYKKNNYIKIKIILIVIFIIGLIYIGIYLYQCYKDKLNNSNILSNITINKEEITPTKTEKMLQLEELKKQNDDIVGWLEIEGTNINYPVMQTTNNEYYMTHNYKKEYSAEGSIFLDKDYNWDKPSTNLLMYGHNNKNGSMFQNLMNYKDEEFYKQHPIINFTTINEDKKYEIIAVFYSRVYYKNEKNVFRYYYFLNADNKEEFDYYINESKKASLYDTGKTAEYGEQLLTLSTCSYHTEDGRFVVVAKKID